jgi:hypothetical protein
MGFAQTKIYVSLLSARPLYRGRERPETGCRQNGTLRNRKVKEGTMHKFLIKVGGQQYEGLFACSCDAVLDALERFPGARGVFVRVVK